METLTLTDFFFWITGIAVIIITTLAVVALLYLIFFLRAVRQMANTAKRTAEFVSEDISQLSKDIKSKGFSIGTLIKFFLGLGKKKAKK